MTAPSDSYDPTEYAKRLIAHRCPELAVDDLIPSDSDEPVPVVPLYVVDRTFEVIDAMADRLDLLEAALASGAVKEGRRDDDTTRRQRRSRPAGAGDP